MIFESRSALRRKPNHSIPVTDVMTGEVIGVAEDLSETGMQLQVHQAMTEDAIYQLRFQLDGLAEGSRLVDAGAHVVWLGTGAQGRQRSGLRFLAISDADLKALQRWTGTAARQR